VYGGNSFATKKPDPEGALKLVTEADVRPDQTAMVGDSHVDIRTGHNAALWTVAVKYGFAPHTLEVEAPDIEVDTPQELSKVFLSRT
jgi:phosphoglycolate phosphatase